MAVMPTSVEEPEGLREKKKERTRGAIALAALELFLERGFDETTVEQIAAKAEVAPRTFFRYFTSKEDVLFLGQEAENREAERLLRERPLEEDPFDSLVRGTRVVLSQSRPLLAHIQRSLALVSRTPALRARRLTLQQETAELWFRGLVGKRTSKAERLRVRMMVAAFVGALGAAMDEWIAAGAHGDPTAQVDLVERTLRSSFGSAKHQG
jgi:AcrR family transcriptional regulator